MSDQNRKPGDVLAWRGWEKLATATQEFLVLMCMGIYAPGMRCMTHFGIESEEHLKAISHALVAGDITREQLDAAVSNGPQLTRLINAAPGNPHKGIVFKTMWDPIEAAPSPPAEGAGNAGKTSLAELTASGKGKRGGRQKSRGAGLQR